MIGLTKAQHRFLRALEPCGGAFDQHLRVVASGETFAVETVLSALKRELADVMSGRVYLSNRGAAYLRAAMGEQ